MLTFYDTPKALEPYIAGFYVIQRERQPDELMINELCLPSGLCNMAFQYKGRFRVQINGNAFWLPEFYTNGQQTFSYDFICEDDYGEITGLVYRPTGLWHFFKANLPQLTNVAMDSCHLFKDGLVHFKQAYKKSRSVEERVALVQELILKQFKDVAPQPTIVDTALEHINQTKGCISVASLVDELGISERYLQKKFKQMVGIAPSVLCRIVRINYLFAEMDSEGPQDFKTLSALFNYYDIRHFSKDFKRYCGQAPTKFQLDRFAFLKEINVDDPFILR